MLHELDDRVAMDLSEGVADVRLTRIDKLNALDPRMMDVLVAAAAWLKGRTDVRAVVLSGAGAGFSAGLDLAFASTLLVAENNEALRARSHGDANLFQHLALTWRDLPIPVIAALHGVVYGGGLQIALGADMRFAAADARFSIMEMRWALIPDMGLTVTLRGQVRPDVLRDLIYTARVFDAAEAKELGLVTRVCDDPHADAMAAARAIAARSPSAIRAAKRLIKAMVEDGRAHALQAESDVQAELIDGGDNAEAFRAHAERREARFTS